MKKEKKLILNVGFILISILVFIVFLAAFNTTETKAPVQTEGTPDYERELNTLIVELEDYWEKRVMTVTDEIKEEILKYQKKTDGFLDEMYSIRVQFGSIGRQIGEWFSKDKEKVENYLKCIWEEVMFTEEDINQLVNRHIYEALIDLNRTSSEMLEVISVCAYEDNIQKQEEFRLRLVKGLEESKKFDFYNAQITRGMLKDSSKVLATSIGGGFVVDIALSSALSGTAAGSGVLAGPVTFGISIGVGFLIDWLIKNHSQNNARSEIHNSIEELSVNVADQVQEILSND